MNAKASKLVGGSLTAIALVGYLTVADELRHLGEFFAVSGIFLSGTALLIAGFFPRTSQVFALPWFALGIGIGMVAGLVIDQAVAGVCSGATIGLFMAYLFRRRVPKSGAVVA